MTETSFPNEWTSIEYGDALISASNGIGGKQNKDGVGLPVSRIETIANETINFERVGYLEAYDPNKITKHRLCKGDILFSHINSPAHLGKTALFETDKELYHGINLLRLVVDRKILVPRLFNYHCRLLRNLGVFSQNAQHAVNQSSLNQKKLFQFSAPLPPLAEQKAIADKLDTLLAQVETTQARLERIPQILKRFRQSVLAAAVSGSLNDGNINKWEKIQLIEIINEKPRNGRSPKGVDHVTPYRNLTLSATTSGKFLDGRFKYVELDIDDSSHLWVKNGDILIQRANTLDYVGISALYRGPDNFYVYPDLMMKCTIGHRAIPEFVHLTLLSEPVRKYFKDNATGTSGNMPKINQKTVSETPFLLPTIDEQTEIVRRVDQLFAHADRIDQQVINALARVNNLTQSILAKAFRGELTEQWRKDNPELISGENSAEALLERIQAERAAVAGKKKPRKVVKKAADGA